MNQTKLNTKPNTKIFSITLLIWLFPALAIISTATLYYRYWQQRGPVVQIQFSEASGIEPQKTTLRFRGVNVGKVEEVTLSENGKGVIVFARLIRDAKNLAVEGTQFFIVQPQVDFQGVRGLETLFRGSYININQGSGNPVTKFIGKSEAETLEPISNSITYNLRSPSIDSISTGDQVSYRGLRIGTVRSIALAPSSQWIDVEIQIEKKYVRVIRTNTIFWQKSGIEAKLSLFDSALKIGSLESLMNGGIAIATPDKPGRIADAGSHFPLQTNPPKEFEKWNPHL